jgi:hypothetical protein
VSTLAGVAVALTRLLVRRHRLVLLPGLAVLLARLAVLLAVRGLARRTVLRLTVLGLAVLGLAVLRLTVRGLGRLGAAVHLAVLGLAAGHLAVLCGQSILRLWPIGLPGSLLGTAVLRPRASVPVPLLCRVLWVVVPTGW